MRQKILVAVFALACGALLAVIGVVSCTTASNNPDPNDLSAVAVDLTGSTSIKPPPPCGILPCPCSVNSVLPCPNDLAVPPPLDLSMLYTCCSMNKKGQCSDCASGVGAGCASCGAVVISGECSTACPSTDMAVSVAPVSDMRPACFGQACTSTCTCTPTATTLPPGTMSEPTPICLTSGCGLYVIASCSNGTTKVCTTQDGASWSCRTCG